MGVQFDWDCRMAAANAEKHGVTFEEAQTVFYAPLARVFEDEAHSHAEEREIIIGRSAMGRLLLVYFVERELWSVRIISARAATRREREDYEENTYR